MSKIFITGDCHGTYTKLGYKFFPEGRTLTKDDYVIICGDFGFWDDSAEQKYWMDWLEARPFSILWVDGNHENFDLLNAMPVEEWHGGNVHFIRPSVIHLMRGQMFNIGGKRFFTFGGARSHDIEGGILELDDPQLKTKMKRLRGRELQFRINHLSWWKEEMPTDAEKELGLKTMDDAGWETDYIITHCCSTRLQNRKGGCSADPLTDYFSTIQTLCSYKHWFFGHYHVSENWGPKETCLYHDIIELTNDGYIGCGLARRFSHNERVRFSDYGLHGVENFTGTIRHIDKHGAGLYAGEQPTANIRTDDGFYHKHIPFDQIQKL